MNTKFRLKLDTDRDGVPDWKDCRNLYVTKLKRQTIEAIKVKK